MKTINLTLFLCLFLHCIFAQPQKYLYERPLSGTDERTISSIIQATNGQIIGAGAVTSPSGDKNGYCSIIDPTNGQTLFEQKRYGGQKNDYFLDVSQTIDGYFLLAGYTESLGQKGDGFLVKINERGDKIWEKNFGGTGQDGFDQIVISLEGDIYLAGKYDTQNAGDIWLLKLDKNANIIWDKKYGKNTYESAKSMVIAKDGSVTLTGNTLGAAKEGGKANIWLTNIDANGRQQWERIFGEKRWEEVNDMIATEEGNYVLCGATNSKGEGELDGWLLCTNDLGSKRWEKTFGGRDADVLTTITKTSDGGYLTAGSTKSQKSGARSTDGWFVKTSADGTKEWEKTHGGKNEDDIKRVVELYEGNNLFVQSVTSGVNTSFISFEASNKLMDVASGAKDYVVLRTNDMRLNTPSGLLAPATSTYLSFNLGNYSEFDLNNVHVRIAATEGSQYVAHWKDVYVGKIAPKGAKTVNIPIRAKADMPDGTVGLQMTVYSGAKELKQFAQNISASAPKPANISIEDVKHTATSDNVAFTFTIKNKGDLASKSIQLTCRDLQGLQLTAAGQPTITIGVLQGGEKKETKVNFKIIQGRGTSPKLTVAVLEGTSEKATRVCELKSGNTSSSGGGATYVLMIKPDPSDNKQIKTSDGFIDVDSKIVTPHKINPKDVKTTINGAILEGSRPGEEDLTPPKVNAQNFYVHNYKNRVYLKPGINRIIVQVEALDGKHYSEEIVVEYLEKKPNLHILAIGPKHKDLKYTTKDVADFAHAFEGQEKKNRFFQHIFVNTLNDPATTTKQEIQNAMNDLVTRYDNQDAPDKIEKQDVLLVFLSSHGKTTPSGFKLLPSDYKPNLELATTIDYKNDIIAYLDKVQCKKVVFFDACHSGATGTKSVSEAKLSEGIYRIMNATPGTSTMASCQKEELSYEDDAWQNGAFTQAILDAFNNVPCASDSGARRPDKDQDKILTLGELYDYVPCRVKQLMEAKPNMPTLQTPFVTRDDVDRQIGIYIME